MDGARDGAAYDHFFIVRHEGFRLRWDCLVDLYMGVALKASFSAREVAQGI